MCREFNISDMSIKHLYQSSYRRSTSGEISSHEMHECIQKLVSIEKKLHTQLELDGNMAHNTVRVSLDCFPPQNKTCEENPHYHHLLANVLLGACCEIYCKITSLKDVQPGTPW